MFIVGTKHYETNAVHPLLIESFPIILKSATKTNIMIWEEISQCDKTNQTNHLHSFVDRWVGECCMMQQTLSLLFLAFPHPWCGIIIQRARFLIISLAWFLLHKPATSKLHCCSVSMRPCKSKLDKVLLLHWFSTNGFDPTFLYSWLRLVIRTNQSLTNTC